MKRTFLSVVLLAVCVLDSGSGAATQTRQQGTDDQTCVPISSRGRLAHGTPFVAPLTAGLELRLRPDGDLGWSITVGRPGGILDYMWVVSPPFRTAPQRHIGPVYGLTAAESAGFPRHLRFVLTDAEYDAALKVVQGESAPDAKLAAVERLGKGRLTIRIDKFAVRDTGPAPARHALDWIEFTGEACVRRR
jgi:hypothetical protein